jgi:hypothetical protein
MKFNFFKKKSKKQFIGKCPVSNQSCFIPECCAGCNDLKGKKNNSLIAESQ